MRRSLAVTAVIAVIATAIGILIGFWINWFPVEASTQAEKIDQVWDVLVVASVPVFVLVVSVVGLSIWKFRMRPGEELKDGPPIHGNTTLEVVWTAIPAIMMVSLSIYAYSVLTDIEDHKANELKVTVTGQQFAWYFDYQTPDGKKIRSDQLYLPNKRPVKFLVKSLDVIHDFWVPAFRMKIDAVPGITTDYRVTPKRIGDYDVVCAELCGYGHATMRQTAHVLSPHDFQLWLNDKARTASAPS
jgi:cytochrome c oxidase subunit 2